MNGLWAGVATAVCVALLVGFVRELNGVGVRRRARARLVEVSRTGVAGGVPPSGAGASWVVIDRLSGSIVVPEWFQRRVIASRLVDRSVPRLLESVARQLRSGASLSGALLDSASAAELDGGRVDPALGALGSALRRGEPVVDAVAAWMGDHPESSRQLAGTALVVAAHTGGATAAVIDGVADTLRDRLALEREVAALSSQARASALLLVVAPLVVAVLAASADPRIASFLLATPAGWACIVLGVILDTVGGAWIHLTIRHST